MTEARQKGVGKVNETRIKVRDTNGDHHGYIELIEKFDFGNLPVEDRRTTNGEERLKIFAKSPTETLRKRLGLDFLHGNNFPHQFQVITKCQEG